MKYTHIIKTIVAVCAVAPLVSVNAISIVVPGTSDPWLANALIDNVGTPEPADVAPAQSPVFVGTISPGTTVSWTATGTVGHPGDPAGPDGAPGLVSRNIGGNNGIPDLSAPIDSLIGVWAFPGGGIPFFMGSSGSAIAPAGTTEFFLGTMDSYGWANNTGSFTVNLTTLHVTPTSTPDAGSTAVLLGGSAIPPWGIATQVCCLIFRNFSFNPVRKRTGFFILK